MTTSTFLEETLEHIQQDGINTLVIVPLYPQYSISTSGNMIIINIIFNYHHMKHLSS